ncbi:DUF1292 domain-containing protein [Pasteuria penetrans]|uniref:DUF1292 domain-containing protein n=1 Tax=Pasteuria penetrans TaxID=86005 RepID=UPI000F9E3C05|nr:DUF1292 domain-containing protein [Pasteuria penetrans]
MKNNRVDEEAIGDHVLIPNREGKEEGFEVLFAFVQEDTGNRYMMVSPLEPTAEEKESDEQDVYAFRYREEGDRLVLFFIEDTKEWDIIEEMFQLFLQQNHS